MQSSPRPAQQGGEQARNRAQVVASNQTLNTLLGVPRLSWMTGAGSAVPAVTAAPPTGTPIGGQRSHRGRGRPYNVALAATTGQPTAALTSSASFSAGQTVPTGSISSPYPSAAVNSPSPRNIAGIRPTSLSQLDQTNQAGQPNFPPIPSPITSPRGQASPAASAQSLGTRTVAENNPSTQVAASVIGSHIQNSTDPPFTATQNATPVQAPAMLVRPSLAQPLLRVAPRETPTSLPQAKRPRLSMAVPSNGQAQTASAPVSTADMLLNIIDDHIEAWGGWAALDKDLEASRYKVIRQACTEGDTMYLVVHQILCLWSINEEAVLANVALSRSTLNTAFMALFTVLGNNSRIRAEHISWLSRFPMQLEDSPLLRQDRVRPLLELFLSRLATEWAPLTAKLGTRGFPIMLAEMNTLLQCPSKTILPIFSNWSVRAYVGDSPTVTHNFKMLFFEDAMNEGQIQSQGLAVDEVNRRRGLMIDRYVLLAARSKELRNRPGATARSDSLQGLPSEVGNRPPPVSNEMSVRPYMNSRNTTGVGAQLNGITGGASNATESDRHRFHASQMMQATYSTPQNVNTVFPNSQLASQSSYAQRPSYQPPQASPDAPVSANVLPSQRGYPIYPDSRLLPNDLAYSPAPTPGNSVFNYSQYQGPSQPPFGAAPHVPQEPHAMARYRLTHHPAPPVSHLINTTRPHPLALSAPQGPASVYDPEAFPYGLHLVGLTSPRRVPIPSPLVRHYQFIDTTATDITRLEPSWGLKTLKFYISPDEFARRACTTQSAGSRICQVTRDSLRYRLRVSVAKDQNVTPSMGEWVASAHFWPELIFIAVNGTSILLRRKQQFRQDLPAELTDVIKNGWNEVHISLPEVHGSKRVIPSYLVTVETIKILDHASVKSMVESASHISVEDVKKEVANRLQPSELDDLIVQNQTISVSLADPFSSTLFEVPVRTLDCKHLECFDLETWLSTRPSKDTRRRSGELCMVDVWKCPICSADARPQKLHIDDFMVHVRQTLLQKQGTDSKNIKINADGEWYSTGGNQKLEGDSRSLSKAASSSSHGSPVRATKSETIEILDDD